MSTLKQKFNSKAKPALMQRFNFTNELQVPRLVKVVVSRGVNAEEGRVGNSLEELVQDIALITGQKPIVKQARKSIAAFKIREGMPNGIMVTLRNEVMYAFLERFIYLAAPRIRDFQGFKLAGDGCGNFSLGLRDQRIFVEAENRAAKGLQITIVTTATTQDQGRALLEELGFPFVKTGASAAEANSKPIAA